VRVVLVPGGGGAGYAWSATVDELRRRGVDAVAPDLPVGPGTGLAEYIDAVVEAAGDASDVVLGALSLGGFTVAPAAIRLPVTRLVFVNAMIPLPRERAADWGDATGHTAAVRAAERAAGRDPDAPFDPVAAFLLGLTPEQRRALDAAERDEDERVFDEPCPFDAWPAVPMRVVAGRDDRFLPVAFQRTVARDRLDVELTAIPGGHLAPLSHPVETADEILRE
jgi:alpha-beta hydrolase superfamily lysophospholipase